MFILLLDIIYSMPIPKRYPGIYFPINDGLVQLELFADPLCPACLAAWPVIQQLIGNYSTQLQVIVHLLPLPYHTWAFVVTQALRAVNAINNSKAQQMICNLYNGDQDKFSNSQMANKSQFEVTELVLQYVVSTLSIDYDTLKAEYDNQNTNARIE